MEYRGSKNDLFFSFIQLCLLYVNVRERERDCEIILAKRITFSQGHALGLQNYSLCGVPNNI